MTWPSPPDRLFGTGGYLGSLNRLPHARGLGSGF